MEYWLWVIVAMLIAGLVGYLRGVRAGYVQRAREERRGVNPHELL